jgi:hypothetical protein
MRSVKETDVAPSAVRDEVRSEVRNARNVLPEDAPETAGRRRLTLRHLHGLIEALREEHRNLEMRVDRLSELVDRMAGPDAGMRRESGRTGMAVGVSAPGGAAGATGTGGMSRADGGSGAGDMRDAGDGIGAGDMPDAGDGIGAGDMRNAGDGIDAGGMRNAGGVSGWSDGRGWSRPAVERAGHSRPAAPPVWSPDAGEAFGGLRDAAGDRGPALPAVPEDRTAFGFAIWAGVERAIGNAAAMLAAGRDTVAAGDGDPAAASAKPAMLFRRERPPEPDRPEVPIESLLLELREAARIADEIAANATAAEHRASPARPARAPEMSGGDAHGEASRDGGGPGSALGEERHDEDAPDGDRAGAIRSDDVPDGTHGTRGGERNAFGAAGPDLGGHDPAAVEAAEDGAQAAGTPSAASGAEPAPSGGGSAAARSPDADARQADDRLSDDRPAAAPPANMPTVFIPRSERHRARKHRSLWTRLFR